MPQIVAPNEGLADQLRYILKASIPGILPWKIMLFVNDIDPDQETVLADLTEASFSGGGMKELDRSVWTDPVIEDDHAVSTYGTEPLVWLSGGGPDEIVFGYAMIDELLGVIRYVQRLEDGDIREITPGNAITILPRVTLTTEPTP